MNEYLGMFLCKINKDQFTKKVQKLDASAKDETQNPRQDFCSLFLGIGSDFFAPLFLSQ